MTARAERALHRHTGRQEATSAERDVIRSFAKVSV